MSISLQKYTVWCKHCDKKFTDLKNLRRHEIIHTSEKNFACKSCEKKFAVSDSLKRHERIHTGENPIHVNIVTKSSVTQEL